MNQIVLVNTSRDGYSVNQVRRTMTVEELIDCLREFEPEAKVYLGFDNCYTYGGITRYDIVEKYTETEEDDE